MATSDTGSATASSSVPIDFDEWLKMKDELSSDSESSSELAWKLLWYPLERLSPPVLRRAIHQIWTETSDGLVDLPGIPESNQATSRLSREQWKILFDAAGGYFTFEDQIGESDPCRPLPTTLFRYAEHGGEIGWSWTTSALKAAAFQDDFDVDGRDGCVWKITTIDPTRLLAHFHTAPLSKTSIAIREDQFEDEYVYTADKDEAEHVGRGPGCCIMSEEDRAAQDLRGADKCVEVYDRFTREELVDSALMAEVLTSWPGAAAPLAALEKHQWSEMFNAIGYTHGGEPAERPKKSLTLYRGSDKDHRENWSWTTDYTVAYFYAGADGQVWKATFEPDRLLARIVREGHDESEYVACPEGLDIEECKGPV